MDTLWEHNTTDFLLQVLSHTHYEIIIKLKLQVGSKVYSGKTFICLSVASDYTNFHKVRLSWRWHRKQQSYGIVNQKQPYSSINKNNNN